MENIIIRTVRPTDLMRCYEIETTSYEGDEAATKEKIETRIHQYPEGFIVLDVEGTTAGFINSGCAYDVVMSDEEFKELVGHDPLAPNVVIMSVVVAPEYQGKGYSSRLMQAFIARMESLGKQRIFLMCKEKHIGLYEKFGFEYLSPSPSEHGGMRWHEMVQHLHNA